MQHIVLKFNEKLRIEYCQLFVTFMKNSIKNLLNEAFSFKIELLSNVEITKCLVMWGEGKTYR